MSDILRLFTNGIISYLLVASVVATVLTVLVWVIIKLTKMRTPVYRYMIWLATLTIIITLPVIWLNGPKLTLEIPPVHTQSVETATLPQVEIAPIPQIARNIPVEEYSSTSTNTQQPISIETNRISSISLKTVLALMWLAGITFMFVRLFAGWLGLQRICLSAKPLSENERFSKMSGRKLKVLLTSQVDSPVCFGVFKPVIILPGDMYKNSVPEDLQMILSHELAHIERRDCLTNFLQRVIEAAFFFHPFVWYASFQLTQQREQICDNYVLDRGASASNYVALLSRIIEQGFEKKRLHAVALFEGRLLSRMRSLLDPKHNNQIKASRSVTIISTLIVLLCVTFGAIRLEAKAEEEPHKNISVYVTSSEGMPVDGASIEALANYKPVGHAKTNGDGKAVLKVPESAEISWIVALKSGEGFDYFEAYEHTPHHKLFEEIPEEVGLVLDGVRNIAIRGVDSQDDAVAGVPFVPWTIIKKDKKWHVNLSGSTIARELTDKKGLAEFDWFPAHTTEDISGTIRGGTTFMVQEGQYFWPDCEQKKPYREYSLETTARLLRNTSISGKVLLPDGSGADEILVRAEGRGNIPFFCRRETRTGSDGSYSINVYPNQAYMITVIDDNWAAETKSGIIVRENRPVRNINLQLSKGTLITGQVTTEPNDQPVAGELVLLSQNGSVLSEEFVTGGYSNKEGLIQIAKTDEDGRYSFRAAEGDYIIGSRSIVLHSQGDRGQKLKIDSEKEIERDFRIENTRAIGVTGGISYAHQEKVYDGAMIFSSCDYCHARPNSKPRPRPKGRMTYNDLYKEWKAECDSLEGEPAPKDGEQLKDRMRELRKIYTHKFSQLAIKHSSKDSWLSSFLWIQLNGVPGPDFDAMMEFMGQRAISVKNENVTRLLQRTMPELIKHESDSLNSVLSQIAQDHSSEGMRGAALYALAARTKLLAERDGSQEGCKQAEMLLLKVLDDYPDVSTGQGKNKDNAQRLLKELQCQP